jgi:D-lactate dehydrogenase
MKIAFFDTHHFEREVFDAENRESGHEIRYIEGRLQGSTAELARDCDVVCSFVNDRLDAETLSRLHGLKIRLIALRSAGFNHVDLRAARELSLPVVRVPEYSPYAVAEHAVALMMTLNRKIHRAYVRVRELNFSIEGLMGFDMHGKTVGVVGTGRIGRVFVKIMNGFGCRVLAYDTNPNEALRKSGMAEYVSLERLYRESDVISLHVPLVPETRHLIDAKAVAQMKPEVLLINTSRGALIETQALVDALKGHKIGGAALDVYEEEEGVFFHDFSVEGVNDDLLARLVSFPQVVITSHQAFLTKEALTNIAQTTLANITQFEKGESLTNQVFLGP